MKKKKIMVTAVTELIVWVQEDFCGNQEIIDIEDVLEVGEFEEKFIYEEVEY